MATVIDGVKAPAGGFQNGGWYSGRQYWDGRLGAPGQIINPNQQGSGQQVSNEVIAQTNPNNVAYIQQQQQQQAQANNGGMTPSTPTPVVGTPSTGTPTALPTTANAPTINLADVYSKNINSQAIKDAQAKIDDVEARLNANNKAHDEAVGVEKNNPWYNEANMQGRINKIDSKYNDINQTLLQEKQGYVDTYNALKGDAQTQTNLALQQFNIDDTAYQRQVSQFNTLLSSGALTNASTSDLAKVAAATGMPLSMVQSIITYQKKKDVSPQVVTSTDDRGNVTMVVVDQNTGEIIKSTSLGAIGKADNSGSGTSETTKTVDKYYAQAEDIFKTIDAATVEEDINGKKVGDQYLSKEEATTAYNRLVGLTNGDEETAGALYNKVFISGGYRKWGNGW